MSDEHPVRVALRVDDVGAAAALYQRMGFEPVGVVPDPNGAAVMAILRRGPLQLLVDVLVGMPFPDSARERRTRIGPRGLGVAIGVEVEDVDQAGRGVSSFGLRDQCRARWMRHGASGMSSSRTRIGTLTDVHAAEVRRDVLAEQPPVDYPRFAVVVAVTVVECDHVVPRRRQSAKYTPMAGLAPLVDPEAVKTLLCP